MTKEYVIKKLTELDSKLINLKIPIVNKIAKNINVFIKEKSITTLKEFLDELNSNRNILNKEIQKIERTITNVDIKLVNKKTVSKKTINSRNELENTLFILHNINCNIKQTLIEIISKIK